VNVLSWRRNYKKSINMLSILH